MWASIHGRTDVVQFAPLKWGSGGSAGQGETQHADVVQLLLSGGALVDLQEMVRQASTILGESLNTIELSTPWKFRILDLGWLVF